MFTIGSVSASIKLALLPENNIHSFPNSVLYIHISVRNKSAKGNNSTCRIICFSTVSVPQVEFAFLILQYNHLHFYY